MEDGVSFPVVVIPLFFDAASGFVLRGAGTGFSGDGLRRGPGIRTGFCLNISSGETRLVMNSSPFCFSFTGGTKSTIAINRQTWITAE
jgi:hypothetical protein